MKLDKAKVTRKGDKDSKKGLAVEVKLHMSDEERSNLVYEKIIKIKEKEMSKAVKELDFETAAILRDEIGVLKERMERNGK
ncbi:MAG: UvrB/UvrC motif-containing protein [Candidatus Nomurabacteria bacterium]|nr:UvrB/UvrC motif-containing protein [Candidatus Nomurabacteria bacterium]